MWVLGGVWLNNEIKSADISSMQKVSNVCLQDKVNP